MTELYQNTELWRHSLGMENVPGVEILRKSYERALERAEGLLAQVRKDFPQLTDHTVDHVKQLWEVADIIAGKGYKLNPLEGYMLGLAFIFHDAAQCYSVYGGVEKLQQEQAWLDYFAQLRPQYDDEEAARREADFRTVRLLHAQKAEKMPWLPVGVLNGQPIFIIEDPSQRPDPNQGKPVCQLREDVAESVGLIARSHNESLEWIKENLDPNRAVLTEREDLPLHTCMVNEVKLACLLRCAAPTRPTSTTGAPPTSSAPSWA